MLDRASVAGVVGDNQDTGEMLRKRFWMGLQPRLKEAARHKYDAIHDFDLLRVVVRRIEHEFKMGEDVEATSTKDTKKTAKMATFKEDGPSSKDFQDLKGMVSKLASSVEAIQKQLQSNQGTAKASGTAAEKGSKPPHTDKKEGRPTGEKQPFACWNCGDPSHPKTECPLLPECGNCHKRGHITKYCRLNRD